MKHLRPIVLNYLDLYEQAREFGLQNSPRRDDPDVSGDECMYDCLDEFIEQNLKLIESYVSLQTGKIISGSVVWNKDGTGTVIVDDFNEEH